MIETVESDKERQQKPDEDGNRKLKNKEKSVSVTNADCGFQNPCHLNTIIGIAWREQDFMEISTMDMDLSQCHSIILPNIKQKFWNPPTEARNHPTEKQKQKPECLIVE